jgi:hypothetical protein
MNTDIGAIPSSMACDFAGFAFGMSGPWKSIEQREMMQQKGDHMVGSKQCARHRRLEFVGHPVRSVRVQLGGGVDERREPPPQ